MTAVIAIAIGLVAGFAAGVAGIGGGVVMIPSMVFFLGFDQHVAQGTSLVAIVFTAVAATRVNVRNRRIDVRQALLLGLGGAIAAPLGARAALALDAGVLSRVFGVFVLFSGLRMARSAWRGRSHASDDADAGLLEGG